MRHPRLLLLALVGLVAAAPAQSQRLPQYARAAVESPQVLARGGAGVALAGPETALFYNPAHLARLGLAKPRIEVFGLQNGVSTKFFGDVGFLQDEVLPEVEDGFGGDDVLLTDSERELFENALVQGRRPTVGQAAVTLPSVMMNTGLAGFGGGFFATNTTRYRFVDDGAGIPVLDLFSQADAVVALAGAARVPTTPLAVGLTGRYARRWVAYKNESFLSIDPDGEQLYVIGGSTVAFDLGLHAADVMPGMVPGALDVGLTVYDLVGGGFDYGLDRAVALTGEGAQDDEEIARILADFDGRDGTPSVRLGAAYRLPSLPALGPVSDAAVALDYVSTSTSESEQPLLSKFRLGAEATVGGIFALRTGLSQGYPTLGAGLQTRFFRLDYVLFGVEDGRLPGQLERYNHLVQLRVGLF